MAGNKQQIVLLIIAIHFRINIVSNNKLCPMPQIDETNIRFLPCGFGAVVLLSMILTSPSTFATNIDFNRDVRPVLSEHCYQCHGPDANQRKTDLRLDLAESAYADRGGYAAIVPGKVTDSELVHRIISDDDDLRMPPADSGDSLSTEQIAILKGWVSEGAAYQPHWAFVPPRRPAIPTVAEPDLPRNPIDHFVLRRLEQRGWSFSRPASNETILRRAALDITGLPPSIDDLQTLESARGTATAYRRYVDRALSSPHYGERMAQNWLDNARYSDTTGFAADKPRTMWLFRDWVVTAFQQNMPFSRFTIEQLAGDMLPNATTSQKIATGFHRNSMQALGNNPRKEEFRVKGIIDRLDTTGRTWLGLTIACAQCHDHKYDPLSQQEYYELFAIFNNIPHYGKTFEIHGPRMDVLLSENGTVQAQVMQEMTSPRQTHLFVRGDFESKGRLVRPNTPRALGTTPNATVMNRLEFARWLVDGQHPLVARVIVNRQWQHFFGTGIVRTTEDFGAQGEWPSHPDLLDWLAVEFVESGWDLRHIHRLIVTSATYRQSSQTRAAVWREDRDNRLLSRGPRHRLAAEQIRDNALAISGLLDKRIGGPGVFPGQPKHIGEFRDTTAGGWTTSEGSNRYRRGLYTYSQRMYPYPSLNIFDAPSRERCVVRRAHSNTPLQALVTLNDPEFFAAAKAFAKRIVMDQHASTDTDLLGTGQESDEFRMHLKNAFQLALARHPTKSETKSFQEYYQSQFERFKLSPTLTAAVTGSKNQNLAAWTMIASTILNLDEVISKQ